MSFEAKDYQVNSILNKVVFSIPRNQRRYVWDQNNWQDLFEDILFSVEQDTPHFIGSIVLEKDGEAEGLTHFTIIDGQQRLASITLLLVAIMKNFLELNMLDDFQGMISYLRSTDIRNRK